MDIKKANNLTEMPLEYYSEKFREHSGEELAERSGVSFENGVFKFRFLGRPTELKYPEMTACYKDTEEQTAPKVAIILARFLMEGKLMPFKGEMLAYRDMPWGNVYLNQFNGRCIMRLAFGFGKDPEKFKRACEGVGGIPAKGGDHAYDIEFIDGFFMRLILWEGDEEFQPSAQILFSDNFKDAFSAEDMAVAGDLVLDAMKKFR